jgi:hypothetical protein
MNSFSAKDLLTRSCMQIKMFAEYPERKPQPSAMVNYGEKFQKAVANTIPNIIGEEMRGRYIDSVSGIVINFSNYIVCNDKIIEVKSVSYPVQDWYFNSSILQCALYKSFILSGANHLETASFYVSLGNERVETYIDTNNVRYILIFGEEKYEIFVSNPYEIVSFFVNKARCCNNWAIAKEWDAKYKHLEYEILAKYIKYKPIF